MTSNLHVGTVQQRIEQLQVRRLDLDLRHGGNLLRAFHGSFDGREGKFIASRQRHAQGVLHGGFAFPGRQLQNLQVFTDGPLVRVPAAQGIVRQAKMTAGEQVLPVHVVREGARLADQRVDDVPVIDVMLAAPAQPRHALHFLARVPHLHLLHTNHHVHGLADQAAMHRVRVSLNLDRAAHAHRDVAQSPAAFQPSCRKLAEHRLFFRKPLLPARVPAGHQVAKELDVLRAAGEVAAAAQPQGLVHGVLEVTVGGFHVAVLMRLADIDPLTLQPVVRQEVAIPVLELSVVGKIVHRRRETVAAVPPGDAPQLPERALQTLAEGLERLRRAQRDRFPIRVRQREVKRQVGKRLAADGHAQGIHVREVRRRQVSRVVDLGEHHRSVRSLRGSPTADLSLEGSPLAVRERSAILALKPAKQRDRPQRGFPPEPLFDQRPHLLKRIEPGPPLPRSR
jgi:hypothetical protein